MKRSNVIVSIGIAVFVIGAATTYLLVKNSDDDSSTTAAGGGATVLYAATDIPAGTTGANAVAQKMVKTKNVSTRPAGALTDISELSGRAASVNVPEGQVLTSSQFTTSQTAIGTLKIPDGKTAIALQLTNVPGVAGYAGAGDKINVYGLTKPPEGVDTGGLAKLVLQNVEILNVNGSTLVSTQGQPGGTGLVFLVAVTAEEGEQLAYLTTFGQLYFALVEKDSTPAPVPSTPGRDPETALEQIS